MVTKELKRDIEELKASLGMISEEITKIASNQRTMMGLMNEIKELKKQNEEQEKRIDFLENRVADMDQYSRINDVIVTGLTIKPRSFASALKGPRKEDNGEIDHEPTTEEQLVAFLLTKKMAIDIDSIESCHTLPTRNQTDKPLIIVRFANRKHKIDLLRQGKNLKGSQVYINEHLTKRNADIARKARFLRKQGKIQSTWTANCKVFIRTNGPPERVKVLCIRDTMQLERLESGHEVS